MAQQAWISLYPEVLGGLFGLFNLDMVYILLNNIKSFFDHDFILQ